MGPVKEPALQALGLDHIDLSLNLTLNLTLNLVAGLRIRLHRQKI